MATLIGRAPNKRPAAEQWTSPVPPGHGKHEEALPDPYNDPVSDMKVGEVIETNVRAHTARTDCRTWGDRRTRHENCCGYCDRYCVGKINQCRKAEIDQWRQEVNRSRVDSATLSADCYQNRPFTASTINRASADYRVKTAPAQVGTGMTSHSRDTKPRKAGNGFLKIKTPKDIGKSNILSYDLGTKSKSWNSTIGPGEKSREMDSRLSHNSDKMLQQPLSEDTDRESVKETNHLEKSVVIYSKSVVDTDSMAASSSLLSGDSVTLSPHPRLVTKNRSYRSFSNEIINVVTIDDALTPGRREALLARNPLSSLDTRGLSLVQKLPDMMGAPESARVLPIAAASDATDASHGTIVAASQDSQVTISHDPENELQGQSDWHKTVAYEPKQVMLNTLDDALQIHRAVDSDKVHRGLYKYDRSYNNNATRPKPESRRFRQLNHNLHRLMEERHLVNRKLLDRVQRYQQTVTVNTDSDAGSHNTSDDTPRTEMSSGRGQMT